MTKWRPIETAPADGTEILAWWPIRKLENDQYLEAAMHIVNWHGLGHQRDEPTHWMHLPEPPPPDNCHFVTTASRRMME